MAPNANTAATAPAATVAVIKPLNPFPMRAPVRLLGSLHPGLHPGFFLIFLAVCWARRVSAASAWADKTTSPANMLTVRTLPKTPDAECEFLLEV
jgi:hypothetical protein